MADWGGKEHISRIKLMEKLQPKNDIILARSKPLKNLLHQLAIIGRLRTSSIGFTMFNFAKMNILLDKIIVQQISLL